MIRDDSQTGAEAMRLTSRCIGYYQRQGVPLLSAVLCSRLSAPITLLKAFAATFTVWLRLHGLAHVRTFRGRLMCCVRSSLFASCRVRKGWRVPRYLSAPTARHGISVALQRGARFSTAKSSEARNEEHGTGFVMVPTPFLAELGWRGWGTQMSTAFCHAYGCPCSPLRPVSHIGPAEFRCVG